jgi:hypothetical protein
MLRPAVLTLAVASLVVSVAACNRQTTPAPEATPPAAATTVAATAAAAAPSKVAAATETGPTYAGFGAAHFGMTSKEIREAWGAPLNGNAPANSGDCYVLTPASAKSPHDLSAMVVGDKFVRYDVGTADETAPGGGKVGMSADEIRSLYAGRIREQPDKYVPGGVDMRVSADDDSGAALIFQTDAGGKVTGWRIGQSPAIVFTEGCS